jgi:ferric iron reductase protein FhuF
LAAAVRDAARSLFELAREQEEWGRTARLTDTRAASIAQSSSPPPLPAILARWRDIERRLADAEPGSQAAIELFSEFQQVRDEYLAAFHARAGAKSPSEV